MKMKRISSTVIFVLSSFGGAAYGQERNADSTAEVSLREVNDRNLSPAHRVAAYQSLLGLPRKQSIGTIRALAQNLEDEIGVQAAVDLIRMRDAEIAFSGSVAKLSNVDRATLLQKAYEAMPIARSENLGFEEKLRDLARSSLAQALIEETETQTIPYDLPALGAALLESSEDPLDRHLVKQAALAHPPSRIWASLAGKTLDAEESAAAAETMRAKDSNLLVRLAAAAALAKTDRDARALLLKSIELALDSYENLDTFHAHLNPQAAKPDSEAISSWAFDSFATALRTLALLRRLDLPEAKSLAARAARAANDEVRRFGLFALAERWPAAMLEMEAELGDAHEKAKWLSYLVASHPQLSQEASGKSSQAAMAAAKSDLDGYGEGRIQHYGLIGPYAGIAMGY